MRKTAEKTINDIICEQKRQMSKQLDDLQKQAQKSIEEKKHEIELLNANLKLWNDLIPKTKELTDSFVQIEKVLTER